MRPDLAVLPPRFLRTKEAAEFLSLRLSGGNLIGNAPSPK